MHTGMACHVGGIDVLVGRVLLSRLTCTEHLLQLRGVLLLVLVDRAGSLVHLGLRGHHALGVLHGIHSICLRVDWIRGLVWDYSHHLRSLLVLHGRMVRSHRRLHSLLHHHRVGMLLDWCHTHRRLGIRRSGSYRGGVVGHDFRWNRILPLLLASHRHYSHAHLRMLLQVAHCYLLLLGVGAMQRAQELLLRAHAWLVRDTCNCSLARKRSRGHQ